MIKNTFDIIILIGRPASGKSEIIDYLKRANAENVVSFFMSARSIFWMISRCSGRGSRKITSSKM